MPWTTGYKCPCAQQRALPSVRKSEPSRGQHKISSKEDRTEPDAIMQITPVVEITDSEQPYQLTHIWKLFGGEEQFWD